MKTILDFGAGWKAMHTKRLRSLGHNVTAWDFGRNFDPEIHDKDALDRQYNIVFASNVLNVHIDEWALTGTIAEIALCLDMFNGVAIVNYPESPRKRPDIDADGMESRLRLTFGVVVRIGGNSRAPVWMCLWPKPGCEDSVYTYTDEEIAAANIRPFGAVGRNAIVPRIVEQMLCLRP